VTELRIDGQVYQLGYDFNSLVDAESAAHCNLLTAIEGLGSGAVTATQLRGLLYAMVVPWPGFPQKPEDALKALGALIRIDTLGPIIFAIGEACAAAVSEEYLEQYRAAMGAEAPEPDAAPPAAEEAAAPKE